MVQVVLYCRCGGSLKARVSEDAATSLRELWAYEHRGERCAPANAKTAATYRYVARQREQARSRRIA